jgi:GNAT superfamily N-acetyltransferase
MRVNIAKTQAEYDVVRQLRLKVNYEELGKDYLFDNQEEIDENATVLFVEKDDEVIGTVRCLFVNYNQEIEDYWGLGRPISRSKIGLTDRLAVLPAFRNSRAAYQLVTQIYKQALLEGSHLALMECEDYLLPFYEHMGFRAFRQVVHSYGLRNQLYINPWNANHLAKVRSPFLGEYNRYQEEMNRFIMAQNQAV